MTEPKLRIPGQVAHISRRCVGRKFLLRPDDYINEAIAYDFALSVTRYGQEVSAATFMSNHYHAFILDTTAKRSDCVRRFNRCMTIRLQSHRGVDGPCWDHRPFGDTVIMGEQTEMEILLYIWLNPVKDGLVERVEDWPGYKILPKHWGKPITVKKPEKYFGRAGPDELTWVPQPPPSLRHLPLEEAIALAEERIADKEAEFAEKRKREQNGDVMGAEKVQALNPLEAPQQPCQKPGPCPRFACDNEALKKSAQKIYEAFLDQYETQRQRWLLGKEVVFPFGTLKLRYEAPISCQKVPDDLPGIYREQNEVDDSGGEETVVRLERSEKRATKRRGTPEAAAIASASGG